MTAFLLTLSAIALACGTAALVIPVFLNTNSDPGDRIDLTIPALVVMAAGMLGIMVVTAI